ncbi:hypothetical protein LEMA_P096450.1 [Plenodomus lingam JN3]|uniref:Zn(2)-C6 fungal-type domain-containing protein n=1 Tax=Leptosphaeria maculans (strain JN3 / isolate v23.1.3 / race Av1-4-5-6-7-8) TaxID=985895 RepID=E5A3M3_LEPMJ|nr:hypothetical protein LEMA_P096450.1 [Plenodomus lingam JN3]CBX98236.1 hypothetical protein LEMA_P096450.1 [Plenodomus lingam JN3]
MRPVFWRLTNQVIDEASVTFNHTIPGRLPAFRYPQKAITNLAFHLPSPAPQRSLSVVLKKETIYPRVLRSDYLPLRPSTLPLHAGLPKDVLSPSAAAPEKKSPNPQQRVRRRNRLITSCLECRRRKLKCDKQQPCTNCTKLSRQCVFITSSPDPETQARLAAVKEKMGILEKSLEEDVARKAQLKDPISPASRKSCTYGRLPGQDESYSDQEEDEDTKDLIPTTMATEDAYYDNEDDDNDDVVDLGFSMGKVRITERIVGLVRPRFTEELTQSLKEFPEPDRSSRVPLFNQDPAVWFAPDRDYVAPSSSFFFSSGLERISLLNHLPSKPLVDKLIAHYWVAVHLIAKCVHRPRFERNYQKFWANINAGVEPRNSFQAVLFAALLSAVVSMPEDKVMAEFRVDKQSLVDNFREGTEAALSRANFLRTTKLETLQAFVMYLIPLCRNDISRAHSALIGSLIRLAECMGLHRDPTTYSTSPVELQTRRLIWYQICFLDLRICEGTGPRPQIRPDDYDTRFPLNINENELERAENGDSTVDVTTDRNNITDVSISRIRFECYEMHRLLWYESPKTEHRRREGERKVSLTAMLARVNAFMAAQQKKWVALLDMSNPIHVVGSEMYGIVSNRLYVMVLQKYMSTDKRKMPDRLRQIILSASALILEHSANIQRQPELAIWSWYVGALHQFQAALILLNELYTGPREAAMEERVWKSLNYAFEITDDRPNAEKVRLILEDLIVRSRTYATMKKIKAPNNMPQPGPRIHTHSYQAREREEREERERSARKGSGAASVDSTPTNTEFSPVSVQPCQHAAVGPMGPSTPRVDWGNMDLPASLPAFPNTLNTAGAAAYSNFATSGATNFLATTAMASHAMASMVSRYSNDSGSPLANTYLGMSAAATGSSPMDSLNDVDWNEIEKMFGSADVGAGNILMPPFSFPEFSASDLQWPRQGES